ncbi:MAG TPA: THUMP domain-containing protein [Candidatus Limnocylindrales bacterium]|nr:THUMP domain-containing protein [Candidatus Limnocylindrales bacterium]
MARGRSDGEDWNVLAICKQGLTGRALTALGRLGRFRTAGYPQVLIGVVEQGGNDGVLAAIAPAAHGHDDFGELLERVVPVEKAIPFVRDDVTEALCVELEPLASRLCSRTFHVRAHLRGLKGRLEHPAVERALGGFLVDRAREAGATPTVRFADPDVLVAVEVVGRRAGYAFLTREMRSARMIRAR